MKKTGLVRDNRFMDHEMGAHHPESPQRLAVIYEMLEQEDMSGKFLDIPVRRATKEELLLVHSSSYVEQIAATEGKSYSYLDPDTQTSEGSYEAALLAAGGLCEAISMVNSGELENAFALVRPPGHHAEKDSARGFCLFNNVAVAAKYALAKYKLDRILIIDFDVHHGKHKTLRVPQRNRLTRLQPACFDFGHIQTDRNGPKGPILKAHPVKHRFIVRIGHEP